MGMLETVNITVSGANLGNGSDITEVSVCGFAATIVWQNSSSVMATFVGLQYAASCNVSTFSLSYGPAITNTSVFELHTSAFLKDNILVVTYRASRRSEQLASDLRAAIGWRVADTHRLSFDNKCPRRFALCHSLFGWCDYTESVSKRDSCAHFSRTVCGCFLSYYYRLCGLWRVDYPFTGLPVQPPYDSFLRSTLSLLTVLYSSCDRDRLASDSSNVFFVHCDRAGPSSRQRLGHSAGHRLRNERDGNAAIADYHSGSDSGPSD